MSNIAFSRVLKISGRLWEFNFRKLPGEPISFHTDFTDITGERVQFILEHTADHTWQIKGSMIPDWIAEQLSVLTSAIASYTLQPLT